MNNTIDLDEVVDITKRRSRINRIDIREAVFVKDGNVIEVSKKDRDEFKFTGLSTIDFVNAGFLKY